MPKNRALLVQVYFGGLFALLVGLLCFVLWQSPDTAYTLSAFLRQFSVMALLCMGLFLEVLCGNADISFAAHTSALTLLLAFCLRAGLLPWVAFLMVLLASFAIALLKWLVVAYTRIPPLISMLAFYMIIFGLGGAVVPDIYLAGGFFALPLANGAKWGLFALFVLVLAAVLHLFFEKTYVGRYCQLIGENRAIVERSGVPGRRVLLVAHLLAAFFFAAVALVTVFATESGSINMGSAYQYEVFAALCLGGASLLGGKGKVPGVLVGGAVMVLLHQTLGDTGRFIVPESIVWGVIILLSIFYWNDRHPEKNTRRFSPSFRK